MAAVLFILSPPDERLGQLALVLFRRHIHEGARRNALGAVVQGQGVGGVGGDRADLGVPVVADGRIGVRVGDEVAQVAGRWLAGG
ncbi:hypothetical protein PFY01_09105 [Brevundimonas vesicularis]|uniref:hypothetical protein n=1 Tax=Brevundimonas vesicularis TaxID=41276 RepID=UPI0022EC2900|nr:hypothetical protein [Brevundimonas vesicularis]WBT04816.1 hypothetical protein PFY01_08675 [Brevundimonas vesicularis]WBT04900.1 hypothetical protein PFY01_09105 [Brevundimonas vesicularis]